MPKPYYEGKGATLYLGDCLEILPTLDVTVDLIVTDPPYGISWKAYGRRRVTAPESVTGDESRDIALRGVRMAMPLLKRQRHCYVFGDWLNDFPDLWASQTRLIWDKKQFALGSLLSVWANQYEPITFGVYSDIPSDVKKRRGSLSARLRRGNVLTYMRIGGMGVRSHPTEKPVPLLRELIESSSRIGETVLDPFVGIGSTCVAAAVEGRKGIGIEIEERYLEVAAKRLESVRVEYV